MALIELSQSYLQNNTETNKMCFGIYGSTSLGNITVSAGTNSRRNRSK